MAGASHSGGHGVFNVKGGGAGEASFSGPGGGGGMQDPAFAAFAQKCVRRVDMIKRYLALDVWTRLMLGTPVDLGQARAGWHGAVDQPNLSIPERPKRGEATLPPPSPPVFAPSDDLSRVYWVTNNVAHIVFLNAGSSQKAPAGFCDDAVAQTTSIFEQIVQTVVSTDGGL
jgi:hypothetical protein